MNFLSEKKISEKSRKKISKNNNVEQINNLTLSEIQQAECGRCPGREKLARVFISTLHQKKLDFTLTNELVSNVFSESRKVSRCKL